MLDDVLDITVFLSSSLSNTMQVASPLSSSLISKNVWWFLSTGWSAKKAIEGVSLGSVNLLSAVDVSLLLFGLNNLICLSEGEFSLFSSGLRRFFCLLLDMDAHLVL